MDPSLAGGLNSGFNPILHEILTAHANLSPQAKEVVQRAGVDPSKLQPGPADVNPQAASPAPVRPISPPGPSLPSLTTPQAAPLVAAPQADPNMARDQAELSRITAPPLSSNNPLAHTKADTGLAGTGQIHNPWGRHALQIADAIGGGFFPKIDMLLPGTQLHHNMLVREQQGLVGQDEARANEESQRATQTAQQQHLGAETAKLGQPAPETYRDVNTSDGIVRMGEHSGQADPLMVNGKQAQPFEKTPTEKPDLKTMLAEAVTDAQRRGVKAHDDPKVQELLATMQEEGRQPVPKEPARDDRQIAIYQKEIKAKNPRLTDDQAYEQAFNQWNKQTKVEPGVARMEVMGQNREYPVINRQSGQLEMRNAQEINASKGTYAPAGAGASAMGKDAVFNDLHYNIDTARKAISGLESMDAGTRAALSYALRHTDPSSALTTFLTGSIGQAMNPQQQEAVQAMALLAENAMTLRGVSGMGQGSDEMRQAILATIPSGKSPTKGYALGQLDKFEAVVKRLEKGVPGMGQAGGAPPSGGNSYADGGKTYNIPPGQEAEFLKDHPKARKQ